MDYPVLKSYIISRSCTHHYHISGFIHNDERFSNDTYVTTSRILRVEPSINDCYLIRTRNSTYICSKEELSKDGYYTIDDVLESLKQ